MKYFKKSERESERGFIYVASRDPIYYLLAVNACNTLKDYFPNAHVTLFTHSDYLEDDCQIFDNVIVDIPVHYRSKMWCMARTPYDKTIYIDADSVVMHKDIRTMHDHLDDCDMFFCPVTPYTTANIKWAFMDKAQTIVPPYHGAINGFNKSALTLDFAQTWFDEYVKQVSSPGWPYEDNHHKEWKIFDMFTLWRMTSGKWQEFERFNQLKIKTLPLRYIITAQHAPEDKHRPVIHQVDTQTWKGIPTFMKRVDQKRAQQYSFRKPGPSELVKEYN